MSKTTKENGENSEDCESKENRPPETGSGINGDSNDTDMVENRGHNQNGHIRNTKRGNTSDYKAVDKIALDYPELGMRDYKMSRDSTAMTSSNSDGIAYQGMKLGQGGLNGLSPLNKSQIISRRLKLDLRNESEVAIAGNNAIRNCFSFRVSRNY